MASNPPAPAIATLIHGDLTLRNVLLEGERVTGLIDWCWSDLGDRRYDLALATDPKPEAFRDPHEVDAFYEGYGSPRLAPDEAEYFLSLIPVLLDSSCLM